MSHTILIQDEINKRVENEYVTSTTTTTTEEPTTTSMWTTTETTTSTVKTEECPECQLPAGVKCNENPFQRALKIVGGNESTKNSWPWIARLELGMMGYQCGGMYNIKLIQYSGF